jgi:hypothetical protein
MPFASRNGLPWSQDDIRRLREMGEAGRTSAEVAEALERTRVGVKSKALTLGISLTASRRRQDRPLPTEV